MKKYAFILGLILISSTVFGVYVEPPYSVSLGGTGQSTFTPNLPLLGNGVGNILQGTLSGNTTEFATSTGALTTGDCVSIDASGNLIDSGSACGSGSGSVTSVALTTPAYLTVTGSPITTSGTLAISGTSEPANEFLAAPNGSAGALAPRLIVAADIPTLNQNTTGTAANVTGIVSVPHGGTGGNTFTSNLPLIGNGAGAIAQGTVTGNTTTFATSTGSLTSGDCVSIDASGNLVDNGTTCGGGGGGSAAYYSAYFPGTSSNTWQKNDTAYTSVWTVNGTPPAITTIKNTGMGTVTIAASNQPGFAFTAPHTGTIRVHMSAMMIFVDRSITTLTQCRIFETTTSTVVAAPKGIRGNSGVVNLGNTVMPFDREGLFTTTASTAYTFLWQCNTSNGPGNLDYYVQADSTIDAPLEITMEYID